MTITKGKIEFPVWDPNEKRTEMKWEQTPERRQIENLRKKQQSDSHALHFLTIFVLYVFFTTSTNWWIAMYFILCSFKFVLSSALLIHYIYHQHIGEHQNVNKPSRFYVCSHVFTSRTLNIINSPTSSVVSGRKHSRVLFKLLTKVSKPKGQKPFLQKFITLFHSHCMMYDDQIRITYMVYSGQHKNKDMRFQKYIKCNGNGYDMLWQLTVKETGRRKRERKNV